jgi:hypothetical protein
MKLLRASCPCGYRTRKARSGYHHDRWWFTVFSLTTGKLDDVLAELPADGRQGIHREQFEIYDRTPRDDKAARREALAKMQALDDEIHSKFIERTTIALHSKWQSDDTVIFDPPPSTAFACPRCRKDTLVLKQVSVIAYCKTGCEYKYEWCDSEVGGCPKCGYRPHRFQTEHEDEFAAHPRTTCWCPCSSSTDSISHVDGYCPKCGNLPDAYDVAGGHFCGKHQELMRTYKHSGNFLVIETDSRWVEDQFPNAKLWGDAGVSVDSIDSFYCASCESDRQRWLESHADNGE